MSDPLKHASTLREQGETRLAGLLSLKQRMLHTKTDAGSLKAMAVELDLECALDELETEINVQRAVLA